MYIIICEIDHQSRLDAWDRVLRAGALGWPLGMGLGGRWEGGSGWGTHVHPWLIHVNVWQKPPQYCKVIQFSSVAQSCLTLCDPMNCSKPGLPVHHQLPESTQLQHARPPCPSPTPRVHPNPCKVISLQFKKKRQKNKIGFLKKNAHPPCGILADWHY